MRTCFICNESFNSLGYASHRSGCYRLKKRFNWIKSWIEQYQPGTNGVDILNADFVDGYIKKFSPAHRGANWGAKKCPEISRVLSNCLRNGWFKYRSRIGLGKNWQVGFPKWVYAYFI